MHRIQPTYCFHGTTATHRYCHALLKRGPGYRLGFSPCGYYHEPVPFICTRAFASLSHTRALLLPSLFVCWPGGLECHLHIHPSLLYRRFDLRRSIVGQNELFTSSELPSTAMPCLRATTGDASSHLRLSLFGRSTVLMTAYAVSCVAHPTRWLWRLAL